MKKAVKVKTLKQAEAVMVAFLRDLMAQGDQVKVERKPGPYEWHACDFRGKRVSTNSNAKICIGAVALPANVCLAVGNELRRWMTACSKVQYQRGLRQANERYPRRMCELARELQAAS